MTDPEKAAFQQRVKQLEQLNSELQLTARRLRLFSIAGTAGLLVLFLLTAAVLAWREDTARKDADYLRWRLEDQRNQRNVERPAYPGPVGRDVE